jgi:hypothetical protein
MTPRPRALISLILLALLSLAGSAGRPALRGHVQASIRASDGHGLSVGHASPRVLAGAERQRHASDTGDLPPALALEPGVAQALGTAAAQGWTGDTRDLRDPALRFPHDATAPPAPRD